MSNTSPLILAILAVTSSWAIAQPQGDPPPRQDPPEIRNDQGTPASPDALRERLLHTLDFAKRIVEKHEAALAQLDAGDNPREVMRALRSPEPRRATRDTQRMNSFNTEEIPESQDGSSIPPPMPTKDDLIQVRAFIAENLPKIDAHLTQIESLDPNATDQLVARLAPKVLEILHLKNENSALSTLKLDELKAGLDFTNASRQYRMLLKSPSNDPDALAKAEQQVRDAATARFDAQVHIKQFEIHQLTQRIQQLHKALAELNAQRDDQVEAQVQSAQRKPQPRMRVRRKNKVNADSEN